MVRCLKAVVVIASELQKGISLNPVTSIQYYPPWALQWSVISGGCVASVAQHLEQADIVVGSQLCFDKALIRCCRKLKYIGLLSTGMNQVDLLAAKQAGIVVRNTERYCTDSVAQHTMALILSLSHLLSAGTRRVRPMCWERNRHVAQSRYPLMPLTGKTLLIVGGGSQGKAVAQRAKAFGMYILMARVPGSGTVTGRIDLDAGLRIADVVSLHCPLTSKTHHLLDKRRLGIMKTSAFLINVARGGLLDEAAVFKALMDGTIGGVGLDVLAEEPPARDNVLLTSCFPNLIVTPHMAWGSPESRQRAVDIAAENLKRYLRGSALPLLCTSQR